MTSAVNKKQTEGLYKGDVYLVHLIDVIFYGQK